MPINSGTHAYSFRDVVIFGEAPLILNDSAVIVAVVLVDRAIIGFDVAVVEAYALTGFHDYAKIAVHGAETLVDVGFVYYNICTLVVSVEVACQEFNFAHVDICLRCVFDLGIQWGRTPFCR